MGSFEMTQDKPKGKRYVYQVQNDHYNLSDVFDTGSVVHNREWGYNILDQTTQVQMGVSFKANCTFNIQGIGAMRTLKIVDDTGTCHGELELLIATQKATVLAKPRSDKIQTLTRNIRKGQPLRDAKAEGDSSTSSTDVEATSTSDSEVKKSDI